MTQEEIAKKLGVSKTTVSRALSGNGRIGKETKEKVLELYNLDKRKKKIQNTLSKNICVAIPGADMISSNTYFSEVLYGVSEVLSLIDYNVIVVKSSEDDISEIQRVVEEKKADGIIFTRSLEHDKSLEYLSSINFPVAVAGHTEYNNVISVDIDNEKAVKELTSILIAKGFRKFTCIVEEQNFVVNKNRKDGFLKAVKEGGLPMEKQFLYTGKFYEELLSVITSNVLSKKTDCIICGDDEIAVKVMSWLRNEGYRIPTDIAIASCYNSATLNVLTPSITAVSATARKIGSMLGKQMVNLIEGNQYNIKLDLDYEILLKRSTSKQ